MSNQVRELITKSIDAYVNFFRRFKKGSYPTPEEIIDREYDADTEFEDSFIVLKLDIENHQIGFTDSLNQVGQDLENIIELIVMQSTILPRPEHQIARSDKMHLWDVDKEDEIVKNAKIEVQGILQENLHTVEKAIHIYDEFLFIFKEKHRVEELVKRDVISRDEFVEEIKKFDETVQKIRSTMPFEIRMNMFLIQCSDLNNNLVKECNDLIDKILTKAGDFVFHTHAAAIQSEVKNIKDAF